MAHSIDPRLLRLHAHQRLGQAGVAEVAASDGEFCRASQQAADDWQLAEMRNLLEAAWNAASVNEVESYLQRLSRIAKKTA